MIKKEVPIFDVTGEDLSKIWFISDTHFDHKNIIEYCNRPFASVEEMNNEIQGLWEATIAPDDRVFFLGDLAFKCHDRGPRWWLKQLPGRLIFIKGSHDSGIRPTSVVPGVEVYRSAIVKAGDMELLLIHNASFGLNGDGWIIRGHCHNLKPFVMPEKKLINVSVEAIEYRPINLATIISTIKFFS